MAAPYSPRIAKVARIGLIVAAAGLGWWMLQPPTAAEAPAPRSPAPTPPKEASGPRAPVPPSRRTLRLPTPTSPPKAVAGERAHDTDGAVPGAMAPEEPSTEPEDPISGLVRDNGGRLFGCLTTQPPYGVESFRVEVRMVPITQGERIFYDADLTIEVVDDTLPAPPADLLESTLDCLEAELSAWSLPATEDAQESHILFGGPTPMED